MPLGPALPNGVRTPSTKTTSRALIGSLSLPAYPGPPARVRQCYSVVTSAEPLTLPEELQQFLQRPGVDHVVGGQPAALGGADAVGHVGQVPDRVRVGVDRELDAGVAGRLDV